MRTSEHSRAITTRRGFVQLSGGFLATLPAVVGGFALPLAAPPAAAYADEDETTTDGDKTHVVVVNPHEVGIVVEDVSTTPRKLLQGAEVTLTSRFPDAKTKTQTVTSDDLGVALFDVLDMCEQTGKDETPPTYAFNGSLQIKLDGYRTFRAKLVRVKGGVGLVAGTRPLEQGVPYPSSVSFDQWDVLYTKNEFLSCTDKDYEVDHTLEVELLNVPMGATVRASLAEVGATAQIATATASEYGGGASLTLADKFLWISDTNAACLKKGKSYEMRYRLGDVTYTVPLQLSVSEAPADHPNPTVSADLKMAPFDDTTMFDLKVTLPDSLPLVGGTEIAPWMPEWPVSVGFNPFGYLRIAYTTPNWGYNSDDGHEDGDYWKFSPRSSTEEQFKTWKGEIEERLTKVAADASLNPHNMKFEQVQMLANFTFGLTFTILAAASWNNDEETGDPDETWRGELAAQVMLAADFSLTETYLAGFIPLLVQLEVLASVTAGLGLAFVAKDGFDFDTWRWDWTSTAFTLTIVVAPTLSLGVGIAGVASASMRGSVALTFFLGVNPLPEGHAENIRNPHIILGFDAKVEVVVQLTLFVKAWTLASYEKPNLINSWASNAIDAGSHEIEGGPQTLLDAALSMQIVKDEALEQVAEFECDGLSGRRDGQLASPTSFLRRSTVQLAASVNGGELAYEATVYEPMGLEDAQASCNDLTEGLVGDELRAVCAENELAPVWEGVPPAVATVPANGIRYAAAPTSAAIAGLGSQSGWNNFGGLHIDSDVKIATDVLSDPRSKIVSIWDVPFVLRLCSAKVLGEARTRIVAQRLGDDGEAAGAQYLLDFDTAIGVAPRDELFDYDFDVVATTEEKDGVKRRDLHLFVFSGIREDGNDTGFVQASIDHLFSYVRWSFVGEGSFGDQRVSWTAVDPADVHAAVDDESDDWCHMFACPQVNLIADGDARALVITYLDRAGTSENAVFGTGDQNDRVNGRLHEGDRTAVGVGVLLARVGWDFGSLVVPDLRSLRSAVGDFSDLSVFEASCSGRPDGGYHTVMLRGAVRAHYLLLGTSATASAGVPGITAVRRVPDGALDAYPRLRLVAVPGTDYYLTTASETPDADERLMRARWNVTETDVSLALEPCGTKGFGVKSFCVDATGEFIYWPSLRDGDRDAYEYDADQTDPDKCVKDPKPVKEYRIMACRLRGETFSDSFVLAEVDHPVDTLLVLERSAGAMAFVTTHVVDAAAARADLYYTVVDLVRCASLAGVEPEVPVVTPGDDLGFYVYVRNDGNTYLRGLTLQLVEDEDGRRETVLGESTLSFGEENTCESAFNHRDTNGNLQGVEPDYALAPGKTSRYALGGFTVPAEWTGTKNLLLLIKGGSLSAAAEEEGVRVHVPAHGEMTRLTGRGTRVLADVASVTVRDNAQEARGEGLADAPVRVSGDKLPGGTTASDAGAAPQQGTRAPLANTGDASRAAQALGAALGAAGAALMAYSARRSRLQNERDDA